MTSDSPLTAFELRSILADMLEGAALRLRPAERTGTQKVEVPVSTATIAQEEGKLTLTVDEAARRLGIGRSAAYEAVRTGVIPSLKIGRRRLIPVVALYGRLDELARRTG